MEMWFADLLTLFVHRILAFSWLFKDPFKFGLHCGLCLSQLPIARAQHIQQPPTALTPTLCDDTTKYTYPFYSKTTRLA